MKKSPTLICSDAMCNLQQQQQQQKYGIASLIGHYQ